MNVEQKLAFFDLLVKTGFKEIEVGFPSASQTEFDFLRRLIDEKRVPDGVTIQVLCQCREHLIKRTFEAIDGARSVIFHMYNSTSPAQRKYTFNMSTEQIVRVALDGVGWVKQYLPAFAGKLALEYSPESFSSTEIDFAVEICERVMAAWGKATPTEKIILNLPTTVEYATVNVFADQIEYFASRISGRDSALISLHNHNDRGTGVAGCELGLLAGADRVEGTLFGNGERTGNLDIVTVALNMYTQGVEPGLDFSRLPDTAEQYAKLTGMDVPPRQPYAGALVFTAFSGSHQDAIRKGMAARKGMAQDALWDVPYLAIDPHDIGRQYEEIIRINSQSGKGGSAWILEQDFGILLPKAMHSVAGALVTSEADRLQRELTPAEIYDIFSRQWLKKTSPLKLLDLAETHLDTAGDSAARPAVMCRASVEWEGKVYSIGDRGNGPLDAFISALGQTPIPQFFISAFHEHSIGSGSDTDAMAYVEITADGGKKYWGSGKSSNIGRAGIEAVVSAVNQME
jgi:2-isopropylmalate synthase